MKTFGKIASFSFASVMVIAIILFSMSIFIVPTRAGQNPVDITDLASYILIGEVKDIKGLWDDNLIYSYVTIFVVDVEMGPESLERENIVVKCIGGGVDDVVLWRSDQPTFAVGEIVRLYLRQEDSIFTVIGGSHGKVLLDSKFEPIEAATVAGYKLCWYKPYVGWKYETSRPGSDWYGPLRWDNSKIPVEYWIDTRNVPSGITESSFIEYVGKSYQTWEDDPESYMDYTYMGTRTDKEGGVEDGVNIFCWRYIDGSGGTLGYCNTWATGLLGDYDSLRITDADIVLDTGDSWSAAGTCPSDKFDVQNVGTHEVGHNLGLADLYDSEDSEMTMYGYASLGETKRRTLEWGDQAGIRSLYLTYTAPTIIDYTPTGADVPVTTTITVTFSEAMNKASAESAFSIFPLVSGSFSWSDNTMIFTPTSNLAYGTTYSVTIGTGAMDLAGNHLLSPYNWQFSTPKPTIPTSLTVQLSKDIVELGKGVRISGTLTADEYPERITGALVLEASREGLDWQVIKEFEVKSTRQYRFSHSWTPTEAGNYIIRGRYSGDETYSASESDSVQLTVERAGTTLRLSVSPRSTYWGKEMKITVTLTSRYRMPMTGQIIVYANDTAIGVIDVSGAMGRLTASFTWTPELCGKWTLRAQYSGDNNYQQSTAKAVTLEVKKIKTTLTLKFNATRIELGKAVNMTITLKARSPPTDITGHFLIEYRIGSGDWIPLDTITIEPGLTVETSYVWEPKEVGKYMIRVTYSGDEHYETSTKTKGLTVR